LRYNGSFGHDEKTMKKRQGGHTMPYQEFQENLKLFSELVDKIPTIENEHMNSLVKSYIEQNLIILNDVFATSIDNLKKLQNAKTSNDIICTQARFTNEINKKLSLSTQRFLNASLGHIADYNEWLKAHCDLATD
jgi:hypothetical protein